MLFLDALYREAAGKAGITYVDVWDGFVDEVGRFLQKGPDFQGQIRQLRSYDGVYFTKAGARKLAHYVEREITRLLACVRRRLRCRPNRQRPTPAPCPVSRRRARWPDRSCRWWRPPSEPINCSAVPASRRPPSMRWPRKRWSRVSRWPRPPAAPMITPGPAARSAENRQGRNAGSSGNAEQRIGHGGARTTAAASAAAAAADLPAAAQTAAIAATAGADAAGANQPAAVTARLRRFRPSAGTAPAGTRRRHPPARRADDGPKGRQAISAASDPATRNPAVRGIAGAKRRLKQNIENNPMQKSPASGWVRGHGVFLFSRSSGSGTADGAAGATSAAPAQIRCRRRPGARRADFPERSWPLPADRCERYRRCCRRRPWYS